MSSRKARFTVLQLMAATVVIAVFCVALFTDNSWWRATLGTISMAMLLNSLLAAIFTHGERRAFSLSYFVAALFFFSVGVYGHTVSLPYLLTLKAFEVLEAHGAHPPNKENFLIVAGIFWLQLTCYSSALVGRGWYRRAISAKASDTSTVDKHNC